MSGAYGPYVDFLPGICELYDLYTLYVFSRISSHTLDGLECFFYQNAVFCGFFSKMHQI